MKPRLGFGRRQEVVSVAESEPDSGEVAAGAGDERENTSVLIESTRHANDAPIRPD
ncbi:MAG: hypothetical protein K0S14_856, partial [Thermomicrobiales bacterium]|nr:hypothetical protein [Thermomicrobiales bacterium]